MNIIVFDVPAESGGALSILRDFHNAVQNHSDETVQWTFVLSTATLEEAKNIRVLNFPWVKKSWFHRLFFDNFVAPKLVVNSKANRVFSLQNVMVKTEVDQIVYMHQSLPFSEYKFSLLREPKFWIYQNIIGTMIKKSILKAKTIVVQSQWIKNACVKKTNVDSDKIVVISPEVEVEVNGCFKPTKKALKTFFYPAKPIVYKNHEVILEASRLLKQHKINDYEILFTFDGNENLHAMKLYKQAKRHDLPITFMGSLERERVFELYKKSVLLFPSHIETFGLPLLEARKHGTPIIASDTSFAKEILSNYSKVSFFQTFNALALSACLLSSLGGDIRGQTLDTPTDSFNSNQSLLEFIISI